MTMSDKAKTVEEMVAEINRDLKQSRNLDPEAQNEHDKLFEVRMKEMMRLAKEQGKTISFVKLPPRVVN
jgi:hypothetical protein